MINRVAIAAAALAAIGCEKTGGDSAAELPPLLEPRDDAPLAFTDPAECAACHENHYNEWRITPHAYALKDPVFKAMVTLGQAQTEAKLGQFCVQCHTPTGLATEQTEVFFDDERGVYDQNLDVDAIGQTGVTCTACHSVTNVVEPVNARVVYTPDGVMRGPIDDPVDNEAHASVYSDLFDDQLGQTSDLCGTCHHVINPKGALIEQTFPEFDASGAKARGETCVSCHMPAYQGKAAVGPDAPEVPERTVHRHTFVGVDVSLLGEDEFPGYYEMRELSAQLLQESAELSASFDRTQRRLAVSIENLAGHGLPSGATAERQMWIELVVRDANGAVVFESGTLDERGDVRDGIEGHSLSPGSDPQLAYYGQLLVAIEDFDAMSDQAKEIARTRAQGECRSMGVGGVAAGGSIRPVHMPWQAHWQCDYFLAPDETRRHVYNLPALPPGSYTASVRLMFRSFPPYFLRILEEEAGLDPMVKTRVPIVEMEALGLELAL